MDKKVCIDKRCVGCVHLEEDDFMRCYNCVLTGYDAYEKGKESKKTQEKPKQIVRIEYLSQPAHRIELHINEFLLENPDYLLENVERLDDVRLLLVYRRS